MLRTQAKEVKKTGRISPFIFLFFTLWSHFVHAGMTSVSLGVTYPTPMGFAYNSLDRGSMPVGIQAQTGMDASFISPDFQFKGTLSYEPFIVRNFQNMRIDTISGFLGLRVNGVEDGHRFNPFVLFDVLGFMYDSTSFTSAVATLNSGFFFANRVAPGFDLSIYKSVGVTVELPIKIIYLKNILTIWDPTFSLRINL